MGPLRQELNNFSNPLAWRLTLFLKRASASAIGCLTGRGAVTTTVLDRCGSCPDAGDWTNAQPARPAASQSRATAPYLYAFLRKALSRNRKWESSIKHEKKHDDRLVDHFQRCSIEPLGGAPKRKSRRFLRIGGF
ncbi:UNVERIFIED_ORG: hypothetical protein JN05_05140 [Zoogloea ramigera]